MIQIAELINHFVNGIVNMATVKKIKTAQKGLCVPSGKRGGGVSCGPKRGPKTEEYKPGRIPRMTKREKEDSDRETRAEMLKRSGLKSQPSSTAPGVRPNERKGSQSFFGGDKYETDARYGKKLAKKSPVKKVKSRIKQSKNKIK
jgi:hypothetical protein